VVTSQTCHCDMLQHGSHAGCSIQPCLTSYDEQPNQFETHIISSVTIATSNVKDHINIRLHLFTFYLYYNIKKLAVLTAT